MKILVLNGSPKKEKSDTIHITKAFLKSRRDDEIVYINVYDQKIAPCMGCFSCWQHNGECIHKDDMAKIFELLFASDVIICSYPLYCYGMPSPLKALVDRLLPLTHMQMKVETDRVVHVSRFDMSKKRFIMISGCGFPDFVGNFDAAILQFQNLFTKHAEIITVSESPMFNVPEADEVTKPFLELVNKAGQEFFEQGKISEETHKKLAIPMIPQEVYLQIVNEQ